MRNSIVPKAPARKALCLAAMLAASALPYAVNAAPASGGDTVQGLYDALLGTMKNGRILGQSGRFTQLEPVKVDYMMRRNGNGWLISDIYLDGAISEVATRRSEFAAILRTDGVDGLIAALNRKADLLTGTTARSF